MPCHPVTRHLPGRGGHPVTGKVGKEKKKKKMVGKR